MGIETLWPPVGGLNQNTKHTMKSDVDPTVPTVFLTIAELRKRWKVSAMFIWRLRRDGKLKMTKFGPRGVRLAISEIERFERESVI